MSLVTNAKNVNFANQFAVDKIVGIYTGSYDSAAQTTVLGGYLYQYAIPHTFIRPVFCELLVSTDGENYQDGGATGGTLSGISYSDSSNIYVTTANPSGVIYYKVIASWIDDYDTTNPAITPVLDTTENFYFNTTNNYQKTYLTGMETASTLGSDNTFFIIHDLGYVPNAKVYFESIAGQVWPQISGGPQDFWLYDLVNQSECYSVINNNTLDIDCLAEGHATKIWYRIYLDD